MLPEEDGQGGRYWLQWTDAEIECRVQCAGRGWGGVAREQVGAEIWPNVEAACQPHLGLWDSWAGCEGSGSVGI